MMTALTQEKITTGNKILDMELPLLTENELERLADYAKYLVWLRVENDSDWADAPLTPEEEAQIEESRRDFENGNYLTLAKFRESQKCG